MHDARTGCVDRRCCATEVCLGARRVPALRRSSRSVVEDVQRRRGARGRLESVRARGASQGPANTTCCTERARIAFTFALTLSLSRTAIIAALAALSSACATTAIDDNYNAASSIANDKLGVRTRWLVTEDDRKQARADVDNLLAKPLAVDEAVRIALAYAPATQALLFDRAAESAAVTQSARLPNPVFMFERLVREQGGIRELEITRTLAVSLLDLILLPKRLQVAAIEQDALRYRLAGDIVQAAIEARQSWIRAVAAQQSLAYAAQVKATADASAELARRMQAVGNFSKLQRARQQAFAADAVAQYARARQAAASSREALIRALGLDEAQAAKLTLPDRLPDLPAAPAQDNDVATYAIDTRLDIRLAQARLQSAAQTQGLTTITSLVSDVELSGVSKSETGLALQKGFEVALPVPVFDLGDASRARSAAVYNAAFARATQLVAEAQSEVRDAYFAYRTADDLARHYRDEVVPLHKAIFDENILRYNGMFIGVFDLLADAREQIASVMQSIDAQRDFWLADASLQAALIGRPATAMQVALDGGGH